jgi:hypothetical protein
MESGPFTESNPTIIVFIFVVIIFLYLHITSQWKPSNDMEIYETDFESAKQLQEVCAVKQPVIIKMNTADTNISSFYEKFQTTLFDKYDNIDIKIKNSKDYTQIKHSVDYVPVSYRSARHLMTTDTTGKYFSERNQEFLNESGLDSMIGLLDNYLKPPLTAITKYDLIIGSPHSQTPLRYKLESHTYLVCSRGKVRVKMCPPKSNKIMHVRADYETYEFIGTADTKVKFLDLELIEGDVLFIPTYWFYNISFSGDPDTTIAECSYDIGMNILAQSKHWLFYYLQQSNIKTRPAKKLIQAMDSDPEPDTDTSSQQQQQIIKEKEPQKNNREIVTNAGTYIVNHDS